MEELVSFSGIKLFQGEAMVSSCFFVFVGQMIVHSFIHECKGLAGISPAVVSYIASGSCDTVLEHLVIQDIPDPCLHQILNEVSHSLSQCENK